MEPIAILGAVCGAALAAAAFLFRRYFWAQSRPFFLVASGGVLALIVLGGLTVLMTGTKGGDAGMIAATVLIFGLLAAFLALLLSLLVAFSQKRALGSALGAVWATMLFEPVAAGFIGYEYQATVVRAAQKRIGEASQEAEQKQREAVARLERQIPEKYRNMPPEIIIEHNKMRAQSRKYGPGELPRIVPEDVEKKIMEYHRAKSMPAISFDVQGYNQKHDEGWRFTWGTVVGWFLGALLIPMAFRRPVPTAPTPGETPPKESGGPSSP